MSGVDLDELLGRVADGDRDAFSSLYDATADLVFGLSWRIVVDYDLAAEITQEVFLEIWCKAGSFDPSRGSARGWVAMMARRRAIDVVRSTQATCDREKANPSGVIDPGDPVGDTVADNDDRARVSVALGTLSNVQREVLNLAFYRGLTHREVAERLEVPLGTVKSRIRDGLTRLASAMRESDGVRSTI